MKTSLMATLAALTGLALWLSPGGAQARRGALATGATHVTVTRWQADVSRNGTAVAYTAPPGGTIRKCASNKLLDLKAYYQASGPTGGRVQEIWKLNGQARDKFSQQHMPASGYFYVANANGIPGGDWSLKVRYAGQAAGHSSVAVRSKRGC